MTRIRADYVFGTVENAGGLNAADTTLTAAGLSRLPAITAPDYATITIHNPDAGTFEVVHVTAHAAGANSATIARGQEGTTAATWAFGTKWDHGMTVRDMDGVGEEVFEITAQKDVTRPLGPYTKKGVVIAPGAAGAWDAGMVEAACPVWVPEAQKYALIYTGYSGTTAAPDNPKLGLAWATNPEGPYTKDAANPILGGSGVAGDPDQYGVTGAMAFKKDDGTWTIYSIGTTAAGYEGGVPSLCRYTTPSLVSPSFTRHGAAVSPGGTSWRQNKAWIGSITERDGTFHLFMNGTASDNKERIGHGTAPSIDGPWTMDTNPVLDVGAAGAWDSTFVGQPWVYKLGETWYMEYYGYNGTSAGDGIATTTDDAFPTGWTKHPANPFLTGSASYDAKHAHKPFSLVFPDRILHFYTAVATDDTRQVALAVVGRTSPSSLVVQDENGTVATSVTQLDFQGAGATATLGTGGEVVVTIPGATGGGGTGQGLVDFARAKRASGDITLTSSTLVNVDTALDLVLSATAGDVIEVVMNGRVEKSTSGLTYAVFDFQTIVGGTPVNSLSSESAAGTGVSPSFAGWASGAVGTNAAAQSLVLAGTKQYTVQAGDVSAGTVTLRLRALVGASCILRASDPILYVQAKNLGPQL